MKLLLLDAYALIFRAYYAMIRSPRVTSTGIDTSAVFGFVNTLQDLLAHEQPSHIAVCFDPGGKTFRHEAFPDYKATRSATPEGIVVAVPYIKRILEAYHIPMVEVKGFEADDVIGTLAQQAQQQGILTYMVTGDKDFGQLVGPKVKIFNPSKGEIMGVEEVKAKYGINDPHQLIDILALMGDTADNIPGCPGVGPKKAAMLVQQFGSVEELLQRTGELKGALKANVEANVEQIRFSKFLATIVTDVPVTLVEGDLRRQPADLAALRQVFDELEFRTLTARLIDQGQANVGLEVDAAQPAAAPVPVEPARQPKQPKQPAEASRQPSLFDELAEPVPASPAPPAAPVGSRPS